MSGKKAKKAGKPASIGQVLYALEQRASDARFSLGRDGKDELDRETALQELVELQGVVSWLIAGLLDGSI